MTLFDQCDAIVVDIEKGFTRDPRDPGNWTEGRCGCGVLVGTKYGISAAAYPKLDIANLTPTAAAAIRRGDYWDAAGCALMPPRAALCAYDCAVNQGAGTAVRLMQQACGIAVDGAIGPATRAAFAAITPAQIARFMTLRDERYEATRDFNQYRDGWLARLFTISMAPLST